MKGVILPLLFAIFSVSGCSKFDLKWLPSFGKQECAVEQFNSTFAEARELPYLFRKTFDGAGLPVKMDAYALGIFPGARRFNSNIKYKGDRVYFFDAVSGDSLMEVKLNIHGRPVYAQEKPLFYQGQREPFPPMRHEFSYVNNRLSSVKTIRPGFTTVITYTYDTKGNVLSGPPEKYVYDYAAKSGRQFYFDADFGGDYLPGFWLLQYLEAFPELTSPPNVRISHTNTVFSVFDLFGHQFDSKKKLVAYKGTNSPDSPSSTISFTITWRCK